MNYRLAVVLLICANATGDARATEDVKGQGVDWSGVTFSTYLGYDVALSSGRQSERSAGAGTHTGVTHVDPSRGTGPYSVGIGLGYNRVYSSGLLIGLETDHMFPNTRTIEQPYVGQASARDIVSLQYTGTARGRVGYAIGKWLFYLTGGYTWSYTETTRENVGIVTEKVSAGRIGHIVGIGTEIALSDVWSARIEYLQATIGGRSSAMGGGPSVLDGSLSLQTAQIGLTYRLGRNPSDVLRDGVMPLELDRFSLRGQTTYVQQSVPSFRAPYAGQNSLIPNQTRQTWDFTLYAGVRPWEGGEIWINPEIDQGFGLSSTLGVAGFPSGEAYKVGSAVPYARIPRAFLRQTVNLGGRYESVPSDLNQFSNQLSSERLTVTVGKFAVTDIFDTNKYAHDPRKDFMNWSIIDTGSFDYAADAWGYTYGAAIEWHRNAWTLRGGLFNLSVVPNSERLDPRFSQVQWLGEIEYRYRLADRAGKFALTGFITRGRMGRFDDAIALSSASGAAADTALVRRYQSRAGLSLNVEQELTPAIGLFARAGVADGTKESFEFTDIDKTAAAGLSVSGVAWLRPQDRIGLAGVINGASTSRQRYLDAGGLGILVGDGILPNPGFERILESYYSMQLWSWNATINYQYVINPAFNKDRGPASIVGIRMRSQF